MYKDSHAIVRRIGETDQLYLEQNTPELSLERADLRLQLVALSHLQQEQIHFLQEAIVLLEQARVSFEEMPMQLYLNLSLHLVKAYMMYYELSKDKKYALISQQILKPLSSAQDGDVYFFLAYAAAVKLEPAMTRHWLNKYAATKEFDLALLQQHNAFKILQREDWFKQMINRKVH